MSTNYPASSDTFDVPGSPGSTTLSSPGTGSRNHVTHHKDLGDAVMAIQANATQITHTHSATGLNGPKLAQANTHQSADTDSAPTALHHTLGTGANQASAGNHVHTNYVDLSSAQTMTGKKSFPSGSNAPAIPDMTNAQHDHSSAAEGGAAFATSISSIGAEAFHPSTVGAGVTTDFYLTNTFTLPAHAGFIGTLHCNWASHNATPGDLLENFLLYASFNAGPANPVYQDVHSVVGGTSNHWRSTQRVGTNLDSFNSMAVPIFMAGQGNAVPMRISARAQNSGTSSLIAISFTLQLVMIW